MNQSHTTAPVSTRGDLKKEEGRITPVLGVLILTASVWVPGTGYTGLEFSTFSLTELLLLPPRPSSIKRAYLQIGKTWGNGIIYKADMLKMDISEAGHAHQQASSAPAGWGDVRHCTGTQGSLGPCPGCLARLALVSRIDSTLTKSWLL